MLQLTSWEDELAASDDGLTSVPEFQRKAGFMMFLTGGESVESFLRGTFEEYIGGNSSTKAFPGGSSLQPLLSHSLWSP